MATLGIYVNRHVKKLLTENTKFFPWWDDLQMYGNYGLITLGMLAFGAPKALGAHMVCIPCGEIKNCAADCSTCKGK